MSLQSDRNPSPPPEILENDEDFVPDRIGNSMYSKRWLYKTLMSMLKVVQNFIDKNSGDENVSMESVEMNISDPNIVELDLKIEEDACMLWDMSANSEVAEFLCECDVAEIFLTIIEHTRSPRLLEIVIGILGNMLTFNSTCEYISRNKLLVHSIIMLSGCSDSCSLVQLFRLLHSGIAKESCQKDWINAFEENLHFMENLKSILENNLCHDVLKGLLEFLDRLLNESSTYCSSWGEESYIFSIIESGKQLLKCNQYEDLDSFFSVVNTLCEHRPNLITCVKHFEALRPMFHGYFQKLGEEETLPQIARVNTISCAFATFGNLLMSERIQPEHIVLENSIFPAMLNISKLVKSLLLNNKNNQQRKKLNGENKDAADVIIKTEERNGSSSVVEDIQIWEVFLEAIIFAAKACSLHTNQESNLQILEEVIQFEIPENVENLEY